MKCFIQQCKDHDKFRGVFLSLHFKREVLNLAKVVGKNDRVIFERKAFVDGD